MGSCTAPIVIPPHRTSRSARRTLRAKFSACLELFLLPLFLLFMLADVGYSAKFSAHTPVFFRSTWSAITHAGNTSGYPRDAHFQTCSRRYEKLWTLVAEAQKSLQTWTKGPLFTLDPEEVEGKATSLWRDSFRLQTGFETAEPEKLDVPASVALKVRCS